MGCLRVVRFSLYKFAVSKESDRERMRKQLDETHDWSCDFMFKFIVPKASENEAALRATFGLKAKFKIKDSMTGKYRSFTVVDNVDLQIRFFSL